MRQAESIDPRKCPLTLVIIWLVDEPRLFSFAPLLASSGKKTEPIARRRHSQRSNYRHRDTDHLGQYSADRIETQKLPAESKLPYSIVEIRRVETAG